MINTVYKEANKNKNYMKMFKTKEERDAFFDQNPSFIPIRN